VLEVSRPFFATIVTVNELARIEVCSKAAADALLDLRRRLLWLGTSNEPLEHLHMTLQAVRLVVWSEVYSQPVDDHRKLTWLREYGPAIRDARRQLFDDAATFGFEPEADRATALIDQLLALLELP
jgi:hypothetical protein